MILVDTNIFIDVAVEDPTWVDWSARQLAAALAGQGAAINLMIYAELARGYATAEELHAALPRQLAWLDVPYAAAFPANRTFEVYKTRGGAKSSPLADFFIGGHAEAAGMTLLTRDAIRFRTYFPAVKLITPGAA